MPRLYVIPQDQPNAFATGRNPKNAAIAVTAGIRRLMPAYQLEGVLAHEFAHIKNRDILVQSVAAMIAGAISGIAQFLSFSFLFGGRRRRRQPARHRRRPRHDRARPARGDAHPAEHLAPARVPGRRHGRPDPGRGRSPRRRARVARARRGGDPDAGQPGSSEPLYIVNPLRGGGVAGLFATHPPIPERVAGSAPCASDLSAAPGRAQAPGEHGPPPRRLPCRRGGGPSVPAARPRRRARPHARPRAAVGHGPRQPRRHRRRGRRRRRDPRACDAATEVVDLRGGVAVPGLTDSHQHPFLGTADTLGADLTGLRTLDEVLDALRRERAAGAGDGWVRGYALQYEAFAESGIDGRLIEEAVGGAPAVREVHGLPHRRWPRPAALALAGRRRAALVHRGRGGRVPRRPAHRRAARGRARWPRRRRRAGAAAPRSSWRATRRRSPACTPSASRART